MLWYDSKYGHSKLFKLSFTVPEVLPSKMESGNLETSMQRQLEQQQSKGVATARIAAAERNAAVPEAEFRAPR